MKLKILKNYLGFIGQVRESPKHVLRQLYSLTRLDARTVTGQNLRNILLLTDKLHVDQLNQSVVSDIKYHEIEPNDLWRINIVKEIIDIKHGNLVKPDGWTEEELDTMLNTACSL